MKKQYTNGSVTYGFSITTRKWTFSVGNYTYIAGRMPKGAETASKVANVIKGSVSRESRKGRPAGLDNLGRKNIEQLGVTI